jgi:hypothetical protein
MVAAELKVLYNKANELLLKHGSVRKAVDNYKKVNH